MAWRALGLSRLLHQFFFFKAEAGSEQPFELIHACKLAGGAQGDLFLLKQQNGALDR